MNSSEWAAWLQAGGALAAVAVAIYVPYRLHTNDRARADTKDAAVARDLALMLLPSLEKWQELSHSWIRCMNDEDGVGVWVAVFHLADDPSSFELPTAVKDLSGRYHQLGSAAEALQRAVLVQHELQAFRPQVSSLSAKSNRPLNEEDLEKARAVESLLRKHCAAVSAACSAVRAIANT